MQIFENTEIAFKDKSSSELIKAKIIFKLMSKHRMVSFFRRLAGVALKFHLPAGWIVKPTIFSHFCGGETLDDCKRTIDRLSKYNIGSIPDYAAENQESEAIIESVIAEISKTIHLASDNPFIPFTVFKPTALASVNTLSLAGSGNDIAETPAGEIEKFIHRFKSLCKCACENGIPIMIDAEESHYQNIIDDLATEMMETYNKEKVIVFNTLQMYRHDRLDFLRESVRLARKKNYRPGFKLVRGAYMDQERERAENMGYPSPIYPDKDKTDEAFDTATSICLENIDAISLFLGTHNEKSIFKLTEQMKQMRIKNNDPRIYISQLYGMSDHISFNMSHCSYNVAKYLPYGPVRFLLPYLLRRAEENKSVTGQAGRELSFIQSEIRRRRSSKKQ